ncbi:MAG: 50S ribosomal protein L23 [Rickettsiales bacterium]
MLKGKHCDIILSPIFTEKMTNMADKAKYAFKIAAKANKKEVKEAVEAIFSTKVASVNILNRPAKNRIFKGKRGKTSSLKKAIVTLEKGKTLDLVSGA